MTASNPLEYIDQIPLPILSIFGTNGSALPAEFEDLRETFLFPLP
jgi:hypothetical protein